jgi:hypothetical protein
MTTRQDLEREREALSEALSSNRIYLRGLSDADEIAYWQRQCNALTESIARIDALLSLSDEQCAYLVEHSEAIADCDESEARAIDAGRLHGFVIGEPGPSLEVTATAHRTVADLVRRTS